MPSFRYLRLRYVEPRWCDDVGDSLGMHMNIKLSRMLLLSSSAIISLLGTDLLAQEALPQITVTAPSPIRRPAPAPAPRRAATLATTRTTATPPPVATTAIPSAVVL